MSSVHHDSLFPWDTQSSEVVWRPDYRDRPWAKKERPTAGRPLDTTCSDPSEECAKKARNRC